MQDEIERLNMIIIDKDRIIDKQIADQKNEWAEIYGQHKQTIDKQQKEILALQQENVTLKKTQGAPNFGGMGGKPAVSPQEFQETSKRLKKRELECQALWDTLKDMKTSDSNLFDTSKMLAILAKRSLDTKSSRKLGIPA